MKPEMIEQGARTVLYDWLHGCSWKLLHFWKTHGTYYCVISLTGDLLFIRLFEFNRIWSLSQDNRMHMYEPDTHKVVDGLDLYYVCDEVK